MSSNSSSRLAIYGAIGANLAIAISKFVAAFFTGSAAMMSEGIHSLIKAKYLHFNRIFSEASALKQRQSGPATPA